MSSLGAPGFIRSSIECSLFQFKWLETELRNAKDNERVFIMAHIPPGFFELLTKRSFFDSENHTRMFQQVHNTFYSVLTSFPIL